jgi:hypothetical protein
VPGRPYYIAGLTRCNRVADDPGEFGPARYLAERLVAERRSREPPRLLADEHLARCARRLEPGSGVQHVADQIGVGDHDLSGVDANPQAHLDAVALGDVITHRHEAPLQGGTGGDRSFGTPNSLLPAPAAQSRRLASAVPDPSCDARSREQFLL